MVSTRPEADAVYNERNLVVVTHATVLSRQQLRNTLVAGPTYRRLTAGPEAGQLTWATADAWAEG